MKFKRDRNATENFLIYINEIENIQNLEKVDEIIVNYY